LIAMACKEGFGGILEIDDAENDDAADAIENLIKDPLARLKLQQLVYGENTVSQDVRWSRVSRSQFFLAHVVDGHLSWEAITRLIVHLFSRIESLLFQEHADPQNEKVAVDQDLVSIGVWFILVAHVETEPWTPDDTENKVVEVQDPEEPLQCHALGCRNVFLQLLTQHFQLKDLTMLRAQNDVVLYLDKRREEVVDQEDNT
jgi:hypothetical protein